MQPSRASGGVAEWPKATGCKPVDLRSTQVRILPPPDPQKVLATGLLNGDNRSLFLGAGVTQW